MMKMVEHAEREQEREPQREAVAAPAPIRRAVAKVAGRD
jgi:hypothetical protein